MPGDCTGTPVAAQLYPMLHPVRPWPLAGFDAALVAQTYAGRPMTTHHVLELDQPLPIEQWQRAVEAWVEHFPELRSVMHHSVTDGHGAVMLFDALLELVQGHRGIVARGRAAA